MSLFQHRIQQTLYFVGGTGSEKPKNGSARLTNPFLYISSLLWFWINCKHTHTHTHSHVSAAQRIGESVEFNYCHNRQSLSQFGGGLNTQSLFDWYWQNKSQYNPIN